jgi:plastocyanin
MSNSRLPIRRADPSPRVGHRQYLVVCISALALVALAACGSSSTKAKSSSGSQAARSASVTPPVVDVTATGANGTWSFQFPPGGVTGGVITMRLHNTSASDTHDIQLVRADGDHSADEVKGVVTKDGVPIPEWLHGAGGISDVAPGQTGEATFRLPAGHYFYFCTDDTNGTRHSLNGMFGEIDVKGDSGAALPTPTAHVNALEYKFETSGLKAGDNLVQFENTGAQLHMVLAAPMQPGKTLDDVKAAFASDDQQAPPPVDFDKAVGTEVVDPGQSVFVHWNLSPGKYAMLCFLNDHAGGPPHFTIGMLQEIDIA